MALVFTHFSNVCSLSSSAYNMPSFEAGAQLLSSLSGYAYTKRAWRKEVFELFMDPLFFTMDAPCARRSVCFFVTYDYIHKQLFTTLLQLGKGR